MGAAVTAHDEKCHDRQPEFQPCSDSDDTLAFRGSCLGIREGDVGIIEKRMEAALYWCVCTESLGKKGFKFVVKGTWNVARVT